MRQVSRRAALVALAGFGCASAALRALAQATGVGAAAGTGATTGTGAAAGTGATTGAAAVQDAAAAAKRKALRIVMVLWRGETEAEQGFREGLEEAGFSVTYTVLDAQQDHAKLGGMLRNQLKVRLKDFDYVYSFGTTASSMTHAAVARKLPHVFNVVTSPVESGIVTSMTRNDDDVSGTTQMVPLELQARTALSIFKFKTLGYLFNPREANSNIIRHELQQASKGLGFTVADMRIAPEKEQLAANLAKLIAETSGLDAVYLPTDSFLLSNADAVSALFRERKVPTIGGQESFVERGAFMGLVPDYRRLGRLAAGIVAQNRAGRRLGEIPIAMDEQPRLMINRQAMRALGIKDESLKTFAAVRYVGD